MYVIQIAQNESFFVSVITTFQITRALLSTVKLLKLNKF